MTDEIEILKEKIQKAIKEANVTDSEVCIVLQDLIEWHTPINNLENKG
jgi:hypothetical protein